MKILITGFDPFGEEEVNPAYGIIEENKSAGRSRSG